MTATNLLVIMDDEHAGAALGCAGHPIVRTPNLDRLASLGTRFETAYTNSPICVPARAAFATGQYPHRTRHWDNCTPYDGRTTSWGHRLQATGHETVSIGKLHFTDDARSKGFDRQYLPMFLHDGGDTHGLIRDDPLPRPQSASLAARLGRGESEYLAYDRAIRDKACEWLREKAAAPGVKPWAAFVSFICPHYPLIAPPEFYDLYDPALMPLPKQRIEEQTASSAWWQAFENCYTWDRYFENDDHRRVAIAAYFGMISFIDDCVGKIIAAIEDSGLDRNTRVVFLSDHGESLGARRLWGKSTMYEEAAGIPMIVAGPGIPRNKVSRTPVSLIDIFPTALATAGLAPEEGLPGRSLAEIANLPDDPARIVFSEYHATGSKSAEYMLRRGRYKYIHYLGHHSELYDLESDPEELVNLALDPVHDGLLHEFGQLLHAFVDPEGADAAAKADQAELIAALGGREAVAAKLSAAATPAPEIPPHAGADAEAAR